MKKDFHIHINHFYSFEYYEDGKKMVIDLDFRDRILYLDTDLIKSWEKPYDGLEISYEEKLKILVKIRECLLERRQPEEVVFTEGQEEHKNGDNA